MDFSVTSLVTMLISTFCSSKCSTVPYGDSCLCISLFFIFSSLGLCYKCLVVIYISLSFCDKHFIIYDFFCDFCSFFFGIFLLVPVFSLVVGNLSVAIFLGIISFVIIGNLFIFIDYLATVFLEVSHPIAVVTFWSVFTFYMQKIFRFVPVFPASGTGAPVLGF